MREVFAAWICCVLVLGITFASAGNHYDGPATSTYADLHVPGTRIPMTGGLSIEDQFAEARETDPAGDPEPAWSNNPTPQFAEATFCWVYRLGHYLLGSVHSG